MEYIKCLETQAQCLLEPLLVEEATNLRSGSPRKCPASE